MPRLTKEARSRYLLNLGVLGMSGADRQMRIAISGYSSNVAKLAQIASLLVGPSFPLIDTSELQHLNLDSERLQELFGSRWIAQGANAIKSLRSKGLSPDCIIEIQERSGDKPTILAPPVPSASEWVISEIPKATYFRAQDFGVALQWLIRHLWENSALERHFNNIVIKVASQCNLNCDYCYMYQMHDRDSQSSADEFSVELAEQMGKRISEYLGAHSHLFVNVILHGGEPLLLGKTNFLRTMEALVSRLEAATDRVRFSIQTNGTLLNDAILKLLDHYSFSVCISVDSGYQTGNSSRVFHSGRSAHPEVMRGLKLAKEYPWSSGCFSGVLSVVNPEESGSRVYRSFSDLKLTDFDFLLRDHTWDTPPSGSSFPFLEEVFNEWIADADVKSIRMFESLLRGLLGISTGLESFGLSPPNTICIGASGRYELLDVLRATYPNAWKLPHSIFDTSLEQLEQSIEIQRNWKDKFDLANECFDCEYLFVCGGGYLPHRYSTSKGFKNPSVHCGDIKKLLGLMERAVLARNLALPMRNRDRPL